MLARVYRNLNTGLWSIQQQVSGKWVVVGHAQSCTLRSVSVRQSETARQKVIRDQCRSVHCWVEGELIAVSLGASYKGRTPIVSSTPDNYFTGRCTRPVTYNPYRNKTLVYVDDGAEYKGSSFAVFTPNQTMLV